MEKQIYDGDDEPFIEFICKTIKKSQLELKYPIGGEERDEDQSPSKTAVKNKKKHFFPPHSRALSNLSSLSPPRHSFSFREKKKGAEKETEH